MSIRFIISYFSYWWLNSQVVLGAASEANYFATNLGSNPSDGKSIEESTNIESGILTSNNSRLYYKQLFEEGTILCRLKRLKFNEIC